LNVNLPPNHFPVCQAASPPRTDEAGNRQSIAEPRLFTLNGVILAEMLYMNRNEDETGGNNRRNPLVDVKAAGAQTRDRNKNKTGRTDMVRTLKALVFFSVMILVGLSSYAYLGDMSPQRNDIKVPVVLNAGQ
jgi:hypothetical protein